MGKRNKNTLPYPPRPDDPTKEDYLKQASKQLTIVMGKQVEVTADNCAEWLFDALRYRDTMITCGSCGHKTGNVPEALRKGLGALYGANMGRLGGM